MCHRGLTFLSVLGILAGPASAGEDKDSSLGIGGHAPPICVFTAAPAVVNSANMSVASAGKSVSQINIDELIDDTTGTLNQASIEVNFRGVCNVEHVVSISTTNGGLSPAEDQIISEGAFIQHVDYRVQAAWAGRTFNLDTDATPGKESSTGYIENEARGVLAISIVIDETLNDLTLPTAAGIYSDSLSINLSVSP